MNYMKTGSYAMLDNYIFEVLARTNLSGGELSIINLILRYTAGYQDKDNPNKRLEYCELSNSRLASKTGILERNCQRTINKLKEYNIISCIVTNRTRKIKVNDVELWDKKVFRISIDDIAKGVNFETVNFETVNFETVNFETEKGVNFETEKGVNFETYKIKEKNKKKNKESIGGTSSPNTPPKAESKKKFIPPTVEEVKAYCMERGNKVDAERFVDYYKSNGWKVGKNSMKDWKATVRNWEKRENDNNSRFRKTPEINSDYYDDLL